MTDKIVFEQVTADKTELFDWAYDLLEESFPPEERRSKDSQLAVLAHPDFRLCVARQNGQKLGVVTYFVTDDMFYFENFCTEPSLRNCGYGSKILHALIDLAADRLFVLEAELPVDSLTTRRVGFYTRNGMIVNDVDHVMPRYHRDDQDLHLLVLSWQRPVTADEYAKLKVYLDENVDIDGAKAIF